MEAKCLQCRTLLSNYPPHSKAHCSLYCDKCWYEWGYWRDHYLRQQIPPPVQYTGITVRDFDCQKVHFLQIGLGTFGTVLVPDTSWMQALLACPCLMMGSNRPPRRKNLRSIGVDCLEESASQQEKLALKKLGYSILLAAVDKTPGESTLWCMSRCARLLVRNYLLRNGVDYGRRADIDHTMAYLENMSGIGENPPEELEWKLEKLKRPVSYTHLTLPTKRIV